MFLRFNPVPVLIFATIYSQLIDCTIPFKSEEKNPIETEKLIYVPVRQKPHIYTSGVQHQETLSWAVKLDTDIDGSTLEDLHIIADMIAVDTGLMNLGQVGMLHGYYIFAHPVHKTVMKNVDNLESPRDIRLSDNFSQNRTVRKNSSVHDWHKFKQESVQSLDEHPFVLWHINQMVRPRVKRDLQFNQTFPQTTSKARRLRKQARRQADLVNPLHFNDPYFVKQWHLINVDNPGKDTNVSGVWLKNITGRGITVAIVDDGLEWDNPDLKENFNAAGSLDLNSGDDDPSPSVVKSTNHHGTRCAGEVAAVANNAVCGVGVAFGAKVSGIRVLDGPMTDEMEATAFTKKYKVNDIYSCSWGPEDNGKTVDGPQHLAFAGMRHGVDYGRNGYGAIYVVASGNGGRSNDNCNYDGYANAIYTVTIGAVDEEGKMPNYSEECASMLAVTYSSSGTYNQGRDIVTTDWTKNGGTGCTESHSGTSAAAPIASALIALMLEARPCLTWRDVQYIIAVTAVKIDLEGSQWTRNAAGLHHSHQHGFGMMNAWLMVNTAKVWNSVPWLTLYTSESVNVDLNITSGKVSDSTLTVTKEMLSGYGLETLEYVHVIVALTHERRGDVEIKLVCPSGTTSIIGATRQHDDSKDGFKDWVFSTVRCWGEQPLGEWKLIVTDTGKSDGRVRGALLRWKLQLYGSSMTKEEVLQRIRLVQDASSGKYLNSSFSLPCLPPPVRTKMVEPLPERWLKIIVLVGASMLIMSLYETFEYACCYNDEKKEQLQRFSLVRQAQALSRRLFDRGGRDATQSESTGLLEEIEMVETQAPDNSS